MTRHPVAPIRPLAAPLVIIVAFVAAGLAVALHHLPALNGHDFALVLLSIGGALAVALGTARLLRPAPAAPSVLVAGAGALAVQPATRTDLDLLVAVIWGALGRGFLTKLGPRFLRAYEASFIDSPHAVALVATIDGTPVGGLTGVLHPQAHARWTLRHRGVQLAFLGFGGLCTRPQLAIRFARTRLPRYVHGWRRQRPSNGTMAAQEAAVIGHVAVLAGARRQRAGTRMIAEFVEIARANEVPQATLETRADERGAGQFYAAIGWKRGRLSTTADGVEMRVWTRSTGARSSPER